MISRNQVKFIRSLHQKKYRELHRSFLAEGSTLVLDLLESSFPVSRILATHAWIDENGMAITGRNIPLEEITEEEMNKITALTSPAPVMAVAGMTSPDFPADMALNELVLALDDIRDPGNLGTILRIADWFGIRHVICSENCVDLYNPKTVQATMGSIARVGVLYTSLAGYLKEPGSQIPVFGTFLDGKNIYTEDLPANGIIIIGNESRGISPEVESQVTRRIHIPSASGPGVSHAESLNASVAAAIVCSEFRRRTIK